MRHLSPRWHITLSINKDSMKITGFCLQQCIINKNIIRLDIEVENVCLSNPSIIRLKPYK